MSTDSNIFIDQIIDIKETYRKIEDLNTVSGLLLKLKSEMPDNRNLLIPWTRRKDEIKQEINHLLSKRMAREIVFVN